MRNVILQMLILFYCNNSAVCQKKRAIDFDALRKWPTLNCERISNNGKYFSYTVETPGIGFDLRVASIDGSWKKEIKGVSDNGVFTADSHFLIFRSQTSDSVGILTVGLDKIRYFEHALDFMVPENGDGRWFACKLRSPEGMLLKVDLSTGLLDSIPNIENCVFDNQGRTLAITKIVGHQADKRVQVLMLDLATGGTYVLGNANGVGDLVFDKDGCALAFLASQSGSDDKRELCYFKKGMDSVRHLVLDSRYYEDSISLVKIKCFDRDGSKLFVYFQKLRESGPKAVSGLSILSYNDKDIQEKKGGGLLMAVVRLTEGFKVVFLQRPGDKNFCILDEGDNFEHVLVARVDPKTTRVKEFEDIYVTSAKDGSRTLVASALNERDLSFSTGGRYLIWYDRSKAHWYSYDLMTKIAKSITAQVDDQLSFIRNMPTEPADYGIVGWLEKDTAVLIYSRYDVWQVDPRGERKPINLSGGYGKRNEIELRRLSFNGEQSLPIKLRDTILLIGFDFRRKSSVFLNLSILRPGTVREIQNDGMVYYYSFTVPFPGVASRFYPIKARDTGVYIIRRMTTKDYPNFYCTTNFKSFKSLTDYRPQLDYNWYSSELVKWRGPDGQFTEGILFRPEDFDVHRKYPIIFHFYERSSDALNFYIGADLCNGSMNIPWFVSNGYLVFVPNIKFRDAHPGRAAYEAVISAVKYLSKFDYVDTSRMGLQGHSYGGYETNYIVSHTGKFAAAAEGSGVADLISDYNGFDRYYYYEIGQGRIGCDFWRNRDLYIENSPIFFANTVSTPLLIMHNRKDPVVRFSQGEEWFTALSRQGKKAWLLSYNDEGHLIWERENQVDFTTRLTQFFGYYLKGEMPPKWMSEKYLREEKVSVEGLNLDHSGSVP